MRTEVRAILFQLAVVAKRKDLIAATVGEYGPIPPVELMQSAGLLNNVQARTQIEMVGVSQNNLCLDIFLQFALMHRFHRSRRDMRTEVSAILFQLAVVAKRKT